MSISLQVMWLLILALPIACASWTITHEEIFKPLRQWADQQNKFWYPLTCEYCLSHYVTLLALIFTHYTLLFNDWRGYIIALFALVWIANFYMTIFGLLRSKLADLKEND